MAVLFDAVGPSAAGAGVAGGTTLSWSHTCTGTNRLLTVAVAVGTGGTDSMTASATYAGVAMTSAGKVHTNGYINGYVQLFYLVAPPTGANTVVVTTSAAPSSIVGGSVSFTGADQTTPLGTAQTAFGNGTAASVAVASTTTGNMVVDAIADGSGGETSSKTLRWKKDLNTSTAAGNAAQSTAAAGGSVTMSYTTNSDYWGIVAAEVLAAVSTATQQAAASLSGSGSLTAGAVQTAVAAAALSGAGSLAVGAVRDQPATAALSGAGALSVAATLARPAVTTLAGGGVLLATPGQVAASALAGGGSLTASGSAGIQVVAALVGGGGLTAAAVAGQLAVAVLAGGGQLLAAATPIRPAGAALVGSGTFVATGQRIQFAVAALAGAGALTATPTLTQVAGTSLAGQGSLTAVAWQTFATVAALAGAGSLTATATLTQFTAVTLTGGGTLLAGAVLQVAPDHSRSQLGLPVRVLVQPTRVIAQNILTGQWLHWELPVSNLAVTFTLSGPTVITGDFPTEIHDLRDVSLEPWATWIHIEEDGLIRASGILQPATIDKAETLSFEAVGVSAYAKGIPFEGAFTLAGTDPATGTAGVGIHLDPADIVRAIWAELQSYPDAKLGVQVTGSTSVRVGTPPVPVNFVPAAGAPVSFVAGPYSALDWWSSKDCGSEIDTLAKATPFDFVERAQWNPTKTAVDHFVDIGFPRAGRRLTEVRFAQDENLLDAIGPEETADLYASQVVMLGSGEGSATVRGYAGRPLGTRLRRVAVLDDKTVGSTARANALASSELDRRQALRDVTEITVMARHPNAPLGSFAVGDEVLLSARVPWAGEVRQFQRVLSYTYSPDSEAVKISMRSASSFSYGGGA